MSKEHFNRQMYLVHRTMKCEVKKVEWRNKTNETIKPQTINY